VSLVVDVVVKKVHILVVFKMVATRIFVTMKVFSRIIQGEQKESIDLLKRSDNSSVLATQHQRSRR